MNKIKGFTLIELIVVIAIIGVLCAILIPSLMGWTIKSRISTNNSNAKELYNGLMNVCVTLEEKGGSVADGVILVNSTNVESFPAFNTGSYTQAECQNLFKTVDDNFDDTSKSIWAANFSTSTSAVLTSVVFSQNSSKYCGGYPVGCPEEAKYATQAATSIASCLSYAAGDSPWPIHN